MYTMFVQVLGSINSGSLYRQYEEKQLQSQQERTKKRLEFSNQISRLQNQLQYEKKKNTAGKVYDYDTHVMYNDMYSIP